jgi:hypothetical protein
MPHDTRSGELPHEFMYLVVSIMQCLLLLTLDFRVVLYSRTKKKEKEKKRGVEGKGL